MSDIEPAVVQALGRAMAAHRDGRFAEAAEIYDAVLATHPDQFDALHLLGVLEAQRRAYRQAEALIARALAVDPGSAPAWCNHGNVLERLQRLDAALASFDKALAIDPDYVEAWGHRGNALLLMKRFDEALAAYDRALAIKPDYAEALSNRGNALVELERVAEALTSFDRVLSRWPNYAEAHYNRGNALLKADRKEEALAAYGRALTVRPDYARALYNRGNLLISLHRFGEAAGDFDRLLSVDPGHDYAPGHRLFARMHGCAWDSWKGESASIVDGVRAGRRVALPFQFLGFSDSAEDQQRCARIYMGDKFPNRRSSGPAREGAAHDRIRLAYLSADFHDHATAFLTADLFERHDRSRFEVTALSFGPSSHGAMRTRLAAAFDRFVDVRSVGDADIVRLLKELEIDIAVDLKGITQDSRPGVFAARAAPIQVGYLGYPGTMGADFIDYLIADRMVVPAEHRRYYDEAVVYLPDTYQVNDSTRRIAEVMPGRGAAGLPERGFVFCSFSASYKITPPVFDVWMRLLHRVEGSVLWLLHANDDAARNLRAEAGRRGVAPDRLVFAPIVELSDHLARHRLADLFLDTLPYNAHTTAGDALRAGLPVLTCLGTTFAGRVAASLLTAIGIPELATRSLDEYEATALSLANDAEALSAVKSRLSRNRATHPLFDTDRFRRHIESAYRTMFDRYRRDEPPVTFSVDPIES